MDRLDLLAEPLRHKITMQVMNEMDNSLKMIKNNAVNDNSSGSCNRMRSSSSFDTDHNLDAIDDSLNRVSAEEMDEQRQQNIAYEYLCHLEEAKKWIETCIREELPCTTECEENLRNGVYLAKLSNFFCPEKVPFKRIYDKDQSKYEIHGLQFRHTDNINHWFNAMEHIGLPKIFFPETTDIYDKKNMPRVIYCLHALSLYLYKLGIATQIQNLYGVAKFTEEEITTMAFELQKYGLKLPEFTKIGGILAEEMPVDEAALHAAILAINDAIEKKDLEVLLNDLQLYDAHLVNIVAEYIKFYHELMYEAKLSKSSKNKANETNYISDVYDELLTQNEIQSLINKINDYADSVISLLVDKLSNEISECINKQDPRLLLQLLKSKCSPFKSIVDKNADWYMAQLTQEKESKLNEHRTLDKETIQHSIDVANLNVEKYEKCLKLLDDLNNCLMNNKRDEFILTLSQHADSFHTDEIDGDYAGSLYFVEFKFIYDEKETHLDIEDYVHGIKVLNVVVDINKAIDIGAASIEKHKLDCLENDSNLILTCIKNPNGHLQELVNDELKLRYLRSFVASKQFKNNTSTSSIMSMTDSKNNISLSDSGHAESEILQCNLLTHGEIQECIVQANAEYKQECHVIEMLNSGDLDREGFNQIVSLMKNLRDEKMNVIDLNLHLYQLELKKHKFLKGSLGIDDFKSIINRCNIILENALNMTKTMLLLNQIDQSKQNEILDLLNDKSLGLHLHADPAARALYYQTFKDLRRICQRQPAVCTITNNSVIEYFWNKTLEEYDFYLNLKNPSMFSWTVPHNSKEATHLITRTILKKAIYQTTQKHEENLLYQSKEDLIIRIQALIRGYLCRQNIAKRAQFYINHTRDVVKIQSWWRMIRQQRAYRSRIIHQTNNLKSIVLIQSGIRMWLCRKDYLKRREHYRQSEKSIIKIQAYVRARNARNDYQSLVNDKLPSLQVVRKFVHLIEQNNTDLTQEIELQELKRQIMTSIKTNKNLEHDLDMMDVKIGLLIKNRITLQDVLIQHKRLRKYKEDIENNQTSQIKQLSKENHEKMDLYQNLFYLLQTRPTYLAKLLFALSPTNSTKFIETVVLQLFNYGANSREEYLLLKLFTASLEQEIESKVDKISDIITGTPLVIKVIVSLYRKHRGENVLRNLLNPIIEEFLNDKSLHLCLNPCELYKNWIVKLESDTGKPSGMPYDITNKAALEHEEIRKKLDENIQKVKLYTAKFLHLILKSIKKVPFGLRYVAKVLRNKLKSKFPQSTDREILKIIGNLIYYRFINSAICSPDVYDVIDTKVGTPLNSDQRKNLACISKHLNLISMSKGYGDTENSHLACLNPFIKESHELIRSYFQDICNVPEADDFFGINEYSDLIVLTKPIVYMTVQDISETHKILVENLDKIATEADDPLRQIFALLKHEPDLESLTARPVSVVSLAKANANDSTNDSLNRSGFSKNTQLCLTLTNRFPPSGDEKTDLNNLMIRTKRLIVELIHCQPGESLHQILKTPATEDQEKYHEYLVKKRERNVKMLSPEYQKIANSLSLSLDVIKNEVIKNIMELKNYKNITVDLDIYEEITSRIAQDIRNQRKHRQRRQKELIHLLEVHRVLNKKSELLKEQVSYYNEYVKACLDSLNSKKGNKNNRNPFKRSQKENMQGSIKYSAAKLYDKGVIIEIAGIQPKQFKNVMFEISTTEEPGIFDVTAKILGKIMEKYELIFQDLLQMQYEGSSIMNMSGFAKINVNLLIFLLNKKFYGK